MRQLQLVQLLTHHLRQGGSARRWARSPVRGAGVSRHAGGAAPTASASLHRAAKQSAGGRTLQKGEGS